MAETVRVRASVDLRDLHRDLESVALGLGKQLADALVTAADTVVRAVPAFTPYDTHHRGDRKDHLGHLRDTFDARKAGAGTVAIVSTHPAAPVFEFGGTIRPKGAPIRIKQAEMTAKAARAQGSAFERQLEAAIERLLARHNL
jgi:hypothetical protein